MRWNNLCFITSNGRKWNRRLAICVTSNRIYDQTQNCLVFWVPNCFLQMCILIFNNRIFQRLGFLSACQALRRSASRHGITYFIENLFFFKLGPFSYSYQVPVVKGQFGMCSRKIKKRKKNNFLSFLLKARKHISYLMTGNGEDNWNSVTYYANNWYLGLNFSFKHI